MALFGPILCSITFKISHDGIELLVYFLNLDFINYAHNIELPNDKLRLTIVDLVLRVKASYCAYVPCFRRKRKTGSAK